MVGPTKGMKLRMAAMPPTSRARGRPSCQQARPVQIPTTMLIVEKVTI